MCDGAAYWRGMDDQRQASGLVARVGTGVGAAGCAGRRGGGAGRVAGCPYTHALGEELGASTIRWGLGIRVDSQKLKGVPMLLSESTQTESRNYRQSARKPS
jgi:hypothetical protein